MPKRARVRSMTGKRGGRKSARGVSRQAVSGVGGRSGDVKGGL